MTINDIFKNPTSERAHEYINISKQLIDLYGSDKKYAQEKRDKLKTIKVVQDYLIEQGKVPGTEVLINNLKEGQKYDMTFTSGCNTIATLKEIKQNFYTCDDYFFTWESGYDGLINEKHNKLDNPKDFPIPSTLLGMIKFKAA